MTQWKKRYISTKFRDDKFVVELDPIEKLLFMYFLTNPLTNVAGIYEISLRRIAFDTWIDKDMVQKIINRFTENKKIYYIDWYVILANSNKHQNTDNTKIKKWIDNVLAWLPKDLIDKLWPIYDSSMTHIWLSNNLDLDLDSDLDYNSKKILSEQETKQKIIDMYTEDVVLMNVAKYRLLLLFIMRWYNIQLHKKHCDKFFSDMIDKSHRYWYSGEWYADRDTLLLKAKEMYEWSDWWREIKNHMSTLNKFLAPNPKK